MTFDTHNEGRSYLSNLREYLPSSAQMQSLGSRVAASVGAAKAAVVSSSPALSLSDTRPPAPRVVLWKSFEEFEFGRARFSFLVLGLLDGFQIFEMHSSRVCRLVAQYSDAPLPANTGQTGAFSAQASAALDAHLLNQRAQASTPIGIVRFLTHPNTLRMDNDDTPPPVAGAAAAPYYGTLLAVCSAEERPNFPRNVIKIFSLAHGAYVHLLRLPRKIFGVHTHPSSRYMCVSMDTEVHVYSTPVDGRRLEFQCVWSARLTPNPSPHIMAALSQGNVGPAAGSPAGPSPLVNLGPNAASLLSTGTFSKDEAAVLAVGRRWVAYCPAELPPPQQATQVGNSGMMAHYAAVEPSLHDPSFAHKSPLFQPLQPSASSPHHGASSSFSLGGSLSGSGGESLSNVASGLASKLYNIAGQGKKMAANYLSGEDATGQSVSLLGGGSSGPPSAAGAGSSVLGTVLVRDMETQRIIACIRAHPNTQVTHLAFDRSGTLLATAPVDGQYVHVYAIVMLPQPVSMAATLPVGANSAADISPQMQSRRHSLQSGSPLQGPVVGGSAGAPPPPVHQARFLYRLFRGITHASIRGITFSLDARFLSVLSNKGTAHVYAINPLLGGDISALTHGPGGIVAANENTLNQQMVEKYAVLQQQQVTLAKTRAASGASAGAAASTQDRGPVGLDVFLSQPKTLSSIYRLKPKSDCRFKTPAPAVYTPVIATFARLPQSEAEQAARSHALRRIGSAGDDINGTASDDTPLHHLLVCGWNEDLSVYSLSTAYQPGQAQLLADGSASPNGASVDPHVKLTLLVQSVANFDLQHTASNNAATAAEQQQQQQARTQPHQQQLDLDQQQAVRYFTQRGEEDEPVLSPSHAADTAVAALPAGFFVDLEPARFGFSGNTSPSGSSPLAAPSSATSAPISIPRSLLSTHSPIFAAIAPNSVTNSPVLQGRPGGGALDTQQQQQHQAASWLSEVELRTHETSDVPLWSSPQLQLCSYEHTHLPAGVPADDLYIEQLGCKPLQYEKFASFAGLTTSLTQPHQPATPANGDASPHVLENDICAALSSSMLDDSTFSAALRMQQQQPDQYAEGGSGSFLGGQMTASIDEEYYPSGPSKPMSQLTSSLSSTPPAGQQASGASAHSAAAAGSAAGGEEVLRSGLFSTGASDSAILDAPLPPSLQAGADNVDLLLSDTPPLQTQAEVQAAPVASDEVAPSSTSNSQQAPAPSQGKKKKKKKGAATAASSANDEEES